MEKILVIIPTYDEAENISRIIPEIFKLTDKNFDFNVLVVDDNSPDGTAEIVEGMKDSRIHLIKRKKKNGLGTAYIAGFRFAIEHNFDFVFEMDADFSHDPNYLMEFIKKINKGYDLIIGSRYINGISVVNWPIGRLFLSYYANIYTRIVTGMNVRDTTAGFMCYRVSSLRQINLDKVKSNGYSFQIEMKFKFFKKNFKISEIPILFIDRRAGSSKMSHKVVYEALFMVWKLRIKSIFGKLL